jgi:hypothetical protein
MPGDERGEQGSARRDAMPLDLALAEAIKQRRSVRISARPL